MGLNQAVKSMAKMAAKDLTLGLMLPRVYERAAKAPIDQAKAVFIAQKGLEVPDNFTLMMAHLRDEYGMKCVFVPLKYDSVNHVTYLKNCASMLREIATARFVFLDDASDIVSCVDLREGTTVVQLWHACGAFKKFGVSTSDLKFGGTRAEVERHPFYGNLGLVTVSSPEIEPKYREAMMLESTPEVVQALGVSRTDVFFDANFRSVSSQLVQEVLPQCVGKKILLYAPTFRGDSAHAKGPDQLDIEACKQALGDEWALVIKHHPFVKRTPPIPESCGDFACYAPSGLTISELLCAADVCMTDYSSVVFEYSLLQRPMVFFAYDIDEYNDWRGFYYDYDEMTPGPVFKTTAEVIDYLCNLETRFDAAQIEAFRERFMSACDGRATERICRTLMPGGTAT